MLEWYRARADFRALERDCEGLLRTVARRKVLRVRGARVRLDRPFEHRSVVEALAEVGVDARTATDEAWSETMALRVEPSLGTERPTFLEGYPASQGAFAKQSAKDPSLVDRFELYVAGIELANGWSELVDPIEQRGRFEEERAARRAAGKAEYPEDERFLEALERCPPCAGIAVGVDRLLMTLLDATSLAEVLPFAADDL
jgi:lysyl-tRNA synthetase class 2